MHDNPRDGISEASPPHDEGAGGASGQGHAADEQDDRAEAERVVRLLVAHSGYAWQGQIIDGLDWSASKTSRVLIAMEEDSRIIRYRVGCKNAVCLPHRVPPHLHQRRRDSPTP